MIIKAMLMNIINQLFSNYMYHQFRNEAKSRYWAVVFQILNRKRIISGVTTAFLKPSGTSPSWSEQFTNLVIDGRRMSMHSLIRNVGNGSNRHNLVGDLLIILSISS